MGPLLGRALRGSPVQGRALRGTPVQGGALRGTPVQGSDAGPARVEAELRCSCKEPSANTTGKRKWPFQNFPRGGQGAEPSCVHISPSLGAIGDELSPWAAPEEESSPPGRSQSQRFRLLGNCLGTP